jgi:hypothetical protein
LHAVKRGIAVSTRLARTGFFYFLHLNCVEPR